MPCNDANFGIGTLVEGFGRPVLQAAKALLAELN